MAVSRQTYKDKDKGEVDYFDCDWSFVNTWLANVEVGDREQLLRDLIALKRGLNS